MFIFRAADGSEQDVTEDVGCLYDLVIGSMDWGSGFLTVEDALPVVRVAKLGGFRDWERAQEYVDDQAHSLEQQEFLQQHVEADAYPLDLARLLFGIGSFRGFLAEKVDPRLVPHDHVWSSVGRCMWRGCLVRQEKP